MQILTTGVLVAAMYRPLRRRSLFPGWRVDVRWRLPSPRATLVFIGYAGPICGVLLTKVLIYGARAPDLKLTLLKRRSGNENAQVARCGTCSCWSIDRL